VLLVIALVVIGYENTAMGLLAGGVIYGVATGILSPALNAWTVDMSHPQYRGKAMATMYISLEAGIGLGALISGWFYQDVIGMVPYILYSTAVVTIMAIIYMMFRSKTPMKHQEDVLIEAEI
jgi:predicted MFS family arabinose efflux permease